MTKLRELRKRAGLKQRELAVLVSLTVPVSTKTISAWELGTRRPTYEAIKRLAEIFGRPVIEMFEIFSANTNNEPREAK